MIPTFKSEVVPKARSGTIKRFQLPLQNFCDGNKNAPITISIQDYRNNMTSIEIGNAQTSCFQILKHSMQKIQITNNQSKKVEEIQFNNVQIVRYFTFTDYLRFGLQINMILQLIFLAPMGIFQIHLLFIF
jgi:hypothetical protein